MARALTAPEGLVRQPDQSVAIGARKKPTAANELSRP